MGFLSSKIIERWSGRGVPRKPLGHEQEQGSSIIEQHVEDEVERPKRAVRLLKYKGAVTILCTANAESPSMKNFTRYVDQTANRIIPNGPAQQDDDQVTLPFPSTSSSFPTHRRSSTPTDSRSKGSLMSRVRRRIGKKSTNERRCTYLAQLPLNIR